MGVGEKIMGCLITIYTQFFKKKKKWEKKFTNSKLCKTNWTIDPNLIISKHLEFKGTKKKALSFMDFHVYSIY